MKKSMILIATGLAGGMIMMGTNMVTRQPSINIVKADVSADGISEELKNQIAVGVPQIVTPEYIGNLVQFEYIQGSTLNDISGLNYGTKMGLIDLHNSNVSNISPLSNLTNLKTLNLNGTDFVKNFNNLDDLKLLTNLTSLDVGTDNSDGTISDISGLKNMNQLKSLNLSGGAITDANDLSGLTSLSDLNLSNNLKLTDISGISNLNNLKTLNLSGDNNIQDYKSLESNKSLTNVTLGTQNINMDPLYVDADSGTVDLSKYIYSKDATVTPSITAFDPNDGSHPTAVYDSSTSTINVGGVTGDRMTVTIKQELNINGKDYPFEIILTQQMASKTLLPSLNTNNVSIKQGQTWDSSSGLSGYTDQGKFLPISSDAFKQLVDTDKISVTGDIVDTNKPGIYHVTYIVAGVPPATITVTVTPKASDSSGNGSSSSASDISDINNLSLITKKADSIPIYDANGKKISDKTLSKLTTFNTTKKDVVDGNTYYEISDGEWVKADDVREYVKESGVLQTKSDSDKYILNLNGVRLNRALKHTTDWLYNGSAEFNGTKYYRVATDEWVKADDVILINSINGVVKANVQATLYKDTGEKSNRALARSSEFITDKVSKSINNETMYRVATDEWVKASDVTFN
ncbi:SLAP domain-containing protein [Companilactobacillus jidongensis]|uniref:SLAP domain-containing protein n=1 Tax=Companilactobacillus jidongensis TaxID=2486006 RepID=UPI0013DE18E7|nr:SLAP domain-containing protein [Companilactobacillus jidongensis]